VTVIEVNVMEIKVDASELKSEKGDVVKVLADFLKEKTSADVVTEAQKVTVKGEGDAVSKKYVKVLLKKFLHKQELKETYRVIMDKDDVLKVKERRLYEEE
jgi:DNA-binding protein